MGAYPKDVCNYENITTKNPPRGNRKLTQVIKTKVILEPNKSTSLSPASGTTRIYIIKNLTPVLELALVVQQPL